MPRPTLALAALLIAALPLRAEDRTTVRLNGRTYSLPAGFALEVVAGPPLVERPVSCDFDDRGRLFVTEVSGTNDRVEKQLADKPHRVLRIEDANGDGRFDRRTVFADKMMLPHGCLWHAGSVFVAAPPSIWKLTDADGDGVAERREEWFKGGTLTGCANDLHGPYRGRDGWLYWTKGAFAKQTYTLPTGRRFETRAAHVFRARPDGSGVEPVMTGGMDNPVGVAFAPGGERIVSATFVQHPAGGRRDGLIHAVYGGVYGKENSCNDGHPRTGPELMPVMTHLGPAAPAGLILTETAGLGADYRHNLFCACFNLHKVTRHVLVPDGATFRTADHDFLTCDDLDFHPTDVKECADGSLLVVDTGGWYKLCCPTSVFHKPEVHGAILRVRRTTPVPAATPTDLDRRLASVWKGGAAAGLRDAAAVVRQAALHVLSVRREASADLVEPLLADSDAAVRRAAAEAYGRLAKTPGPALVAALERETDPTATHSLTYALIEIGDASATARLLTHSSPNVRRAALLAGTPSADSVVRALSSSDAHLRAAAKWVAGQHPDWADALLPALRQCDDVDFILHFIGREPVRDMLAGMVDAKSASGTRQLGLRAMAGAKLKAPPRSWADAVATCLANPTDRPLALDAARGLASPKLTDALAKLARDASQKDDVRVQALALLPALDTDAVGYLIGQFDSAVPLARRLAAADALARAKLSNAELKRLATAIAAVGPIELERLWPAYAKATDEAVGLALVESLQTPGLRASLRADTLKPRLDHFGPRTHTAATALYAAIDADTAQQRQKLDTLFAHVKGGDVRRGQAIFAGTKAVCATCHSVGYVGGSLGPDLTKVGATRTERDLLEAIVFPSASFVRGYEPVTVTTLAGKSVNGILKRDADDAVIVATAADKEERIERKDVATIEPGVVSLMPAGLDQQLTPQELADLVAFLKACR